MLFEPPAIPQPSFQIAIGVGLTAFFVASLAVGLRLLWLWHRTRQRPELLIALGVLCIGPVGCGLTFLAEGCSRAGSPLAAPLFALALTALAVGSLSKFLFNALVYHPGEAWVRRLVAASAGVLVLSLAWEAAAERFADPLAPGVGYFLGFALRVGCLAWGSAEALRYWLLMRRRLSLGLADPVVTNRFLLWGAGAGTAASGSAIAFANQALTGLPLWEVPWLMLSSSLHGLLAAVCMWLAFLPPASYRQLILSLAGRAQRDAELVASSQ